MISVKSICMLVSWGRTGLDERKGICGIDESIIRMKVFDIVGNLFPFSLSLS